MKAAGKWKEKEIFKQWASETAESKRRQSQVGGFILKLFFVLKFSTISVIRKENGRLNCVNFLYQI